MKLPKLVSRRRLLRTSVHIALALLATVLGGQRLEAQVRYVVVDMRSFLLTDNESRRAAMVPRLLRNEAYEREKIDEYIHWMELHEKLEPGDHEIEVDLGNGARRKVALRIPAGYDPQWTPYPLIYALHPEGGDGPSMLRRVEKILGPEVDKLLVAAPSGYHEAYLTDSPPFRPEHRTILEALRRKLHVESDRVYGLGEERGGDAVWSLAMLYPDDFAGMISLAGAYPLPPQAAGLQQALTPNFDHLPILHVWAERDRRELPALSGKSRREDLATHRNEALAPRVEDWGLATVTDVRRPRSRRDKKLQLPGEDMSRILAATREHFPKNVHHLFRHTYQGRAYWLEATGWQGDSWSVGDLDVERQPGESQEEAAGRTVLSRLGLLHGEIEGQTVRVRTRHVANLVVWFGDGMIDWNQPVTVELNGKKVFEGRLTPDPGVMLRRVLETWDLDRLLWAGLRISVDGTVKPVTADPGDG